MIGIVALIVLSFVSKGICAVDAFIIFTDANGKATKVAINHDGSFITPPLPAGTYSFSFGATQSGTAGSGASGKSGKVQVSDLSVTSPGSTSPPSGTGSTPAPGAVSGYSLSSGGDRPSESLSFNFTKITWTYQEQAGKGVKQQKDMATGMSSGKRQHQPVSIMKVLDASSPKLMTADLGSVVIDVDGDALSGSVVAMTSDGKKMAADDWLAQ